MYAQPVQLLSDSQQLVRERFTKFAKFQDRQLDAWYTIMNPRSKYILYGGAAGGGKSYLLRWCAVGLGIYYYLKYGIERVPIGLFSEDYPTLRDRQITKIMREFPDWLGTLKDSQRDGLSYTLAPELGSAVIMLRNLDDPKKYASVEFAAELVEELTKNPSDKFEDLRTRMRFPGIEERKFIGATNPGEVGHGWVKRLWVKPDLDNPDFEQNRFFYIPAKYSDNLYNPSDYDMQLKAIRDPQKRKALLDGDWDVFAGQYFEEWRDNLHVIKPFIPNAKSLIVGGMDWGRSSKPSHKTAFYFSLDVVEKVFWEDISWYRCRTFFEVAGKDKTPKEWAFEIRDKLRNYGLSLDNIAWIRGDPAMFKKKEDGSDGISEEFMKYGIRMTPANNDRLSGWEVIHKWLSIAPDGLPYWQVSESCPNLIRTLPELVHDENNPEDVDSEGEDHPGDAERYKHKHLKFIDASAGAVTTDKNYKKSNPPALVKYTPQGPRQVSINTDLFAIDRRTTGPTRVISST